MKHSNNQGDQGSIYITVMIILAILLLLLSMLIIIAGRDVRASNLYSEGIRAYYIAHSGIAKGIVYTKGDPKASKAEVNENNIFSSTYPAVHSLRWKVEYNSTEKNYKIVSVGEYRYSEKITVKRILEVIVRTREGAVEVDSWKQVYEP